MGPFELPPHDFDIFEDIGEEPESTPAHDCDCWRLTRVLEPNEQLPDHVCVETARVTSRQWWRQQASDLLGHADMACIVHGEEIEVSDKEALPLDHVLNHLSTDWPVSYRGRHVGVVIQQWTAGSESKTLARQLATDVRWSREIRRMRQLYELLTDTKIADSPELFIESIVRQIDDETVTLPSPAQVDPVFAEEWLKKEGWSASKSGLSGEDLQAVDELQSRLRSHGLPFSRSVLRHLRAVAAGMQEPLPAAELLVTTLVYVGTDEDGTAWFRQNPEVSAARSLTTGPLTDFRNVVPIAKGHRAFVERYAKHPFADLKAIRRAQPGSAADPDAPVRTDQVSGSSDYIEEARSNIDQLRQLALEHKYGQQGAVTENLNRVQRRVSNRRRRLGWSPKPPDGWRDQLRPELFQVLKTNE